MESLGIKTIALSLLDVQPGSISLLVIRPWFGVGGENNNTYAIVVITKTNEHKSNSFTSCLGENRADLLFLPLAIPDFHN